MRGAALALLLIAGACEKQAEDPPAPQPEPANATEPEVVSPVLLRYRPAAQDGVMAANVQGVLDFNGPCVRIQDSSGRFRTVVSAAGSRLERDSAGLYWRVGDERLRHGSSVVGGGGEIPRLPPDQVLDGAVPEPCRAGPAIELIGPRRQEPAEEPTPTG